jgi:hypothetical protein
MLALLWIGAPENEWSTDSGIKIFSTGDGRITYFQSCTYHSAPFPFRAVRSYYELLFSRATNRYLTRPKD